MQFSVILATLLATAVTASPLNLPRQSTSTATSTSDCGDSSGSGAGSGSGETSSASGDSSCTTTTTVVGGDTTTGPTGTVDVNFYSDTACQTLLDVVTIAYDGSGIYVEAAPDGSFSGEYVDSDGQGLSLVGLSTNADGSFPFTNLPNGRCFGYDTGLLSAIIVVPEATA